MWSKGKIDWIEVAKDVALLIFILGGITWLETYL